MSKSATPEMSDNNPPGVDIIALIEYSLGQILIQPTLSGNRSRLGLSSAGWHVVVGRTLKFPVAEPPCHSDTQVMLEVGPTEASAATVGQEVQV